MAKVGLSKASEFAKGAIQEAETAVTTAERQLVTARGNIDSRGLFGRRGMQAKITQAEKAVTAAKENLKRVTEEQIKLVQAAEKALKSLES